MNKQRGSSPAGAAWRREVQTYTGHLNLYGKEICLLGQHYLCVVSMVACSGPSIPPREISLSAKKKLFCFKWRVTDIFMLQHKSVWQEWLAFSKPCYWAHLMGSICELMKKFYLYPNSHDCWKRKGEKLERMRRSGQRRCWLSLGRASSIRWRLGWANTDSLEAAVEGVDFWLVF